MMMGKRILRLIVTAVAFILAPTATAQTGDAASAAPVRVVVFEDLVDGLPPEGVVALAKLKEQVDREFMPRMSELRDLEVKFGAATTPEEKARLEQAYRNKLESSQTDYNRRYEGLAAPVMAKMQTEFPLFVASKGAPEVMMVSEADLAAAPGVKVVKITAEFAAWMNARP
jgi:Skp family chaperone for outer membrane proteins